MEVKVSGEWSGSSSLGDDVESGHSSSNLYINRKDPLLVSSSSST